MPLDCAPYTLDCPPTKRYCTSESAADAAGLTLLFAHCIGPVSAAVGADKEQWEPTIAGWSSAPNTCPPRRTPALLIEPSLAAPPLFHAHVAPTLPPSWASRAEARAWLAPRAPWRGWDARVLQAFVDHGLHETSDGDAGVALKCAPQQEAVAYPDVQPHFAAIIQNALADAVPGRTFASVTRVEGGHMLVQEQPDRMARAICDVLDSVDVGLDGQAQGRVRSRL
ncbi:hypothetical protein B0H10DRAFT_2063894 [Mycena sp. CBHHK59/15]|nr:hypothetical protein B0H10DRAFT_2063894 [Mycena sp. CBHHK59/15]